MSHKCPRSGPCSLCESDSKSSDSLGPGAPKKGHPAYKNSGGVYVSDTEKQAHLLSSPALSEVLSGRPGEAMKLLEEKVGKKRAEKMIKEAERAWGIPEKGFKGFIKRKLG